MRLAIITSVNYSTEANEPQMANEIPISTGDLADEIVRRVKSKFIFLASKPEVESAIREALLGIEGDVKSRTVFLGPDHA